MKINGISNINSSKQQQKSKTQKINFGQNPSSAVAKEIRLDGGIVRLNMNGMEREVIDFFQDTKKIHLHIREYLPKHKNSRFDSLVENFVDGTKEKINRLYRTEFNNGQMPVKETKSLYEGKKLTSKIKEYHGEDKNGKYFQRMEVTYHPMDHSGDKPVVAEVIQNKWYKCEDENDFIQHKEPIKIVTKFDEKGTRLSELRPTSYGWEIKTFDEKGKNVVGTTPIGNGDNSISYYGAYGCYTPEKGMEMYPPKSYLKDLIFIKIFKLG